MSTKLKLYLGRKIIECIGVSSKTFTPTELLPWIHIGKKFGDNFVEMNMPLDVIEKNFGIVNLNKILKIEPDEIIKQIYLANDRANRKLSFHVEKNIFLKDVMENCETPDINLKTKTIVVEYSSPNIAKPFHFGHLRSTIIGNFLGNLYKYLHHKVTKLNYLGDWGTQFGLIKIGVEKLNYSLNDIKDNPLKLLYESYVYANKLAEKDAIILEKAKSEFSKLEEGNEEHLRYWKEFMNYTKTELDVMYKRLGVEFDEYYYESMYNSKNIQNLTDLLLKRNIMHKQNDGRHVVTLDNNKTVSILKSDGSSLYLTRDIASAVERYNKYKFDKMYYIVDNSQSEHFKALREILFKMDMPWATRLHHIKFGRIRGMSTRKGKSIFLKDILDECKDMMIKKQINSPTTKVPINDLETSDILGISCVIINDLKQRRQKDYDFTWEKALQVQGDTGIKLQYTHCRLCSLEENSGVMIPKKCIPNLLQEIEALNLIKSLASFQDVLYRTEEQCEACLLVNYLFFLCNDISRALKTLKVKGTEPEIAQQRLLLFMTSKKVLNSGMRILGLQPLNKM